MAVSYSTDGYGTRTGNPQYDYGQNQPKATTNTGDPNRASQITDMYGSILGRKNVDPNDPGLQGWINGNYSIDQVAGYLYNSPEAVAFRNNQSTQTPAQQTTTDWANKTSWTQADITAYGASRGIQNFDPGGYWMGKWNEWGSKDPGYFYNRLMHADEFGNPLPPENSGGGGQPAHDPRWDALYQQLLDRSNQTLNIDPNTDPNIRTQADAFSANQTRSSREALQQMAESGGPNANLTGQIALQNEKAGQASGAFESSLIGHEIDSRRTEIQNALSQMGGMLTTEQQTALQEELAQLNAATQRYSIDTQNQQFLDQFGLNAENMYNYWQRLNTQG